MKGNERDECTHTDCGSCQYAQPRSAVLAGFLRQGEMVAECRNAAVLSIQKTMIEEKKTVQDRGIAIALSALMVLSVVAVGAAAITPAAAQTVDQADRSVDSTEVQPGDTVQVTVDVDFDQGQSFQIDEGFSPAFSNAEIVDSDGASSEAAEDDRVVARYGVLGDPPRGSATLVYEVEIPDDADAGDTFEISSNADSDVELGTTVITVTQGDGDGDGSRTAPSTAQAGDTVQVTVDVAFDQAQSFQIDEGFSPAFSNVEIVDADGASTISAFENAGLNTSSIWKL